jgi:hypothetical protein
MTYGGHVTMRKNLLLRRPPSISWGISLIEKYIIANDMTGMQFSYSLPFI